jgi:ABC-type dipeptide/oligopeptide/nickel transport system ATPase component
VPRPGMRLARRDAVLEVEDAGCLFRQRCPRAFDRCATEPELIELDRAHAARCWLAGREGATATSGRLGAS